MKLVEIEQVYDGFDDRVLPDVLVGSRDLGRWKLDLRNIETWIVMDRKTGKLFPSQLSPAGPNRPRFGLRVLGTWHLYNMCKKLLRQWIVLDDEWC